jgi:hypothetical protein
MGATPALFADGSLAYGGIMLWLTALLLVLMAGLAAALVAAAREKAG